MLLKGVYGSHQSVHRQHQAGYAHMQPVMVLIEHFFKFANVGNAFHG